MEADIFVRIENGKKQTGIQIYCDKIKKTQMCFNLGEQQIKKVYDCLLTILTEDEDEE